MKLTLAIAIMLSVGSAFAQQSSEAQTKSTARVHGSGCVSKGVESSCLVLTDSKTGKVYNLIFADHVPAAGTAIKFVATEHQGMTTCMQGTAVNVSKWKPLKSIKCPADADAHH